MREKGLIQKARSFVFRNKMCQTLNILEDEIRSYLLDKEKKEIIIGGFKIAIDEEGQVEVIELPPLNLKQMNLPLNGAKPRKEA